MKRKLHQPLIVGSKGMTFQGRLNILGSIVNYYYEFMIKKE